MRNYEVAEYLHNVANQIELMGNHLGAGKATRETVAQLCYDAAGKVKTYGLTVKRSISKDIYV